MKKSILFGLLVVCWLVFQVEAYAQAKKYSVKAGIVTFEMAVKMGGQNISNEKLVVYFDDFGIKERKDTYQGETLKQSYFSDGKELYTVMHAQKVAYKRGQATRGTEFKVDWNEVSSKDKETGKARKLANLSVTGKDCECFEMLSGDSRTRFAGWDGICLLADTVNEKMKIQTTIRAVKFEEKPALSADIFQVPAGYAVKPYSF